MHRLWVCIDIKCDGAALRSYDDIAYSGEPYCPQCSGETRLTPCTVSQFEKVGKMIRM